MLANLRRPVSLRTFSRTSLPSRYSTGSVLSVIPPASRKPAWIVPSKPLISTRKLNPRYGSLRCPVGISQSSWGLLLRIRRPTSLLADADDHEFGRLDRSDADDHD